FEHASLIPVLLGELFLSRISLPRRSAPFPYPTLFRSPRPRRSRCAESPARRRSSCRTISGGPARRRAYSTFEVLDDGARDVEARDRKSTRLNSSHVATSYAVFWLNKKKTA